MTGMKIVIGYFFMVAAFTAISVKPIEEMTIEEKVAAIEFNIGHAENNRKVIKEQFRLLDSIDAIPVKKDVVIEKEVIEKEDTVEVKKKSFFKRVLSKEKYDTLKTEN